MAVVRNCLPTANERTIRLNLIEPKEYDQREKNTSYPISLLSFEYCDDASIAPTQGKKHQGNFARLKLSVFD